MKKSGDGIKPGLFESRIENYLVFNELKLMCSS